MTLPSGLRLFWWVRLRSWRAGVRALLGEPVKLGVLVVAWSLLLGGIYLLSLRGIQFIYDALGVGPFLLNRLWFLLLFVITLLLAVSQLPSAYSTLVRAPETRYWMVLPVSARTLCRAKWLESSVYSSWSVALLITPLGLAYLAVLNKPWWLIGWVGIVLLPLMGIATALSTMILLVWLRWVGRLAIRRELIPFGFVLACGALFWLVGERHTETEQDVWFLTLQSWLPRMRIAMSMWLPSSWAATAFDAWLQARWQAGLLYAGLLWTTLLVCWRLLDHCAAGLLWRVLRQHATPTTGGLQPSADAAHDQTSGRIMAASWWMRRPLAASLVKDLLLILRDPMQWSQAVVFFGLLGAYFGNIHRLASFSGNPAWRVGIVSLNLASTLLIFGSLAVRFIFPQMSVEGRCLWLLRMTPRGMERLLISKLLLYGALALVVVDGLLMLSVSRLAIPSAIQWWLAGVGTVGAFTLVGLTVGLGACWIDLAAQDAARVVSSSKGALALVLMLGYMACVIVALVVAWTTWSDIVPLRIILVSLGLLGLSLVTGWLPVHLGLRRLDRLEYTG